MKKLLIFIVILSSFLWTSKAYCPSIGGGIIGSQVSMTGIPQVSATTITGTSVYYTNLYGPDDTEIEDEFLKIDGSNANTTIDIGSENLTTTGTGTFDEVVVNDPTIPTAVDSVGTKGMLAYDSTYWYACISTNNWKRVAWDTAWVVITAPDTDFTYENDIVINLETDLGMILE